MELLFSNPKYKDLPEQKQLLVSNQYLSLRKKTPLLYLWLVILGGIGAHHYYMGNIAQGILCTLFCWTFIPGIISFFELFVAWGYVKDYNEGLIQYLISGNA